MWIINNSLLGTFLLCIQAYRTPSLRLNCMIYWKGSLTPEERASLLPITFALSGRMIGSVLSTLTSLVGSFVPVLTFLSTISTSVSETRFFDKLLVYRWALTVHTYWLICSSTLSSTISCSQQ